MSPKTQRKNEVGFGEGWEREADCEGDGLVQNMVEEEKETETEKDKREEKTKGGEGRGEGEKGGEGTGEEKREGKRREGKGRGREGSGGMGGKERESMLYNLGITCTFSLLNASCCWRPNLRAGLHWVVKYLVLFLMPT